MTATRLLQLISWHHFRAGLAMDRLKREKNYHERKALGAEANRHSLTANAFADQLVTLVAKREAASVA